MGGTVIVIVLLVGLFWLVLVRPQRRQAAEQRELLGSLALGDEIVSAGGLYGVITSIDGDELHVEIADGLVVRMARGAVAGLVERDEQAETAADADDPAKPS